MILEKPAFFHNYDEALETNSFPHSKSHTSFRARDPTVPILSNLSTSLSPQDAHRRMRLIADCARKILVRDQIAIVVLAPHIVQWVTLLNEEQLGNHANDVTSIAEALENRLGAPNSELVAEHVVRASTRAQLGIQNRATIELRGSEKLYRVDLDCYFDHPDLHAIVALMTPLNDPFKSGYEGAQLSSMRYHLSVLTAGASKDSHQNHNLGDIHRNNNRHRSSAPAPYTPLGGIAPLATMRPSGTSTMSAGSVSSGDSLDDLADAEAPINPLGPWGSEVSGDEQDFLSGMSDFIPSVSGREVEHFYSMLPSSTLSYADHEYHISMDRPIHEEELLVADPDNFSPHFMNQSDIPGVTARRPRDPAVVQAELEQEARLYAHGGALSSRQGTFQKKNDIHCLQCGVDSSPEWRKGPMGPKTLCNRCGLRYAKKLRSAN